MHSGTIEYEKLTNRRVALQAAAQYCQTQGWRGPDVVIDTARTFEVYLNDSLVQDTETA